VSSAPASARARPIEDAQRTSLLALVPELTDGLAPTELDAVAAATAVRTCSLPSGPFSLEELIGPGPAPIGVIVADGLIVRDILLAGGTASDLLGPGDVAAVGAGESAMVPAVVRWSAATPSRIAVLDAALFHALEPWPGVGVGLLNKATRQTSDLAVQRAFSQLPRVDLRLLALFWHLAERWGRVGTDGIVVRLTLTHEALGRMVGSRRPTVSLALKELAADGTVVRREDGAWVLRRDGLARLAPERVADWKAPDAAVLPELRATTATRDPAPTQTAIGERLRELDESYTDREQRVREVLARCAETRETLLEGRRRRAAERAMRSALR
jgi:CRP/FNR family cyclic AMP-dependent transcriptional regulator